MEKLQIQTIHGRVWGDVQGKASHTNVFHSTLAHNVIYGIALQTMNKIGISLISVCLLTAGCNRAVISDVNNAVSMPGVVSDDLRQIISKIELIPLEEDDNNLLGSKIELYKGHDNTFIAVDKPNQIVNRYAYDGSFLNTLGLHGNGPTEFSNLTNIQIVDSVVFLYSYPNHILSYDQSGVYLKTEEIGRLGYNSYYTNDGFLCYYGYSSENKHKLGLTPHNQGESSVYFLPFENKVLDFLDGSDLFSQTSDGITLIIDPYCNSVYKYENKEVTPFVTFDFGKYSIDKRFFTSTDPYTGGEYLIKGNYALISRFLDSNSKQLVQVDRKMSNKKQEEHVFGIRSKDRWEWGYFLQSDQEACCPFRFFDGDVLYGIIEPSHMDRFLDTYGAVVSNLSEVTDNLLLDNHVIAKFYLD